MDGSEGKKKRVEGMWEETDKEEEGDDEENEVDAKVMMRLMKVMEGK